MLFFYGSYVSLEVGVRSVLLRSLVGVHWRSLCCFIHERMKIISVTAWCLLLCSLQGIWGIQSNEPTIVTSLPVVTMDHDFSQEDFLSQTLTSMLTTKMSEAKDIIIHGHPKSDIASLDPFQVEPLAITVQEPNGFLNVSLRKIVVQGLGDFELKDIATNWDVLRTSVLLKFPKIKVKASYKLKGYLNPPLEQSLADEGIFEATVDNAGATWVGKVEPFKGQESDENTESVLSLTQAALRFYWDTVTHTFKSFMKKNEVAMSKAGELLRAVTTAVIEKLQKIVEEAMEEAIAHVMGRSKASWFEMFPTAPQPRLFHHHEDDDGSPVHRHHSIQKRQVPCENGEGLDDYVDTLLRFGRRLLRFQEPISFPNTTIKVDDMLTVFLYNGGIRGVSNVNRKKNAYVKCTNTTTTLGMVVQIDNLRISAKYRVLKDYRLLLFNGEADIRVKEVIVLLQLTQFEKDGETRQRLDRLKIWKLGRVTVRLRGLGNLTSALAMLIQYQINEDPHAVIPVAEAQITHVVRQQLNNITIPIFSII